ncbi:MAG: hypothetical protein ABDH66_00015 [Bacteroidia bacterium]
MRRARLLHSPEEVEVLQIDKRAQIAIIRRHGFKQSIPLKDIVIDEGESSEPLLLSSQPRLDDPPIESETEIELYPRLSEKRAELSIAHRFGAPCFYALYIQKNDRSWLPLHAAVLTSGQVAIIQVDMEAIAPPWQLLLQRLEIPQQAVVQLPVISTIEIPIKLSMLTKAGRQRIFPIASPPSSDPSPTSAKNNIRTPTPSHEIDLHIEALAPHMQGCSADAIFSYQVSFMKRFLYACEAARLPFTVVIHGVGKKKLQSALLKFCEEQGWTTEPLLLPPYMGGATRVRFSP